MRGSVTIDASLLESADIAEFEQVHIYDVTSGSRVITYAMVGPPGSGVICINGAAAHLVHPGTWSSLPPMASPAQRTSARTSRRIIHVDRKETSKFESSARRCLQNRPRRCRRHFRKADPVIHGVFKQVGPCTLKPQRDRFNMLVRSIISQQISTSAARSIRAKLEALIAPEKVSPEVLARFSLEQ